MTFSYDDIKLLLKVYLMKDLKRRQGRFKEASSLSHGSFMDTLMDQTPMVVLSHNFRFIRKGLFQYSFCKCLFSKVCIFFFIQFLTPFNEISHDG